MKHERGRRLALAAAIVATLLLLILVLWVAPDRLVARAGLTEEARARLVVEERRTMIALLVAIGGALSLYYTHRRHELERASNQLDRDANYTDRYTKAVEQLGHGSADVQLGGIYALERIAEDSSRDRSVIIQVLSAFVREHSAPPKPYGPPGEELIEDWRRLPTPVTAALTVLGRRPEDDTSYPNPTPDLRRAHFEHANLERANLWGADLTDAHLLGANLSGANLAEADLYGADLVFANLSRANLDGAHLNGADLSHANLSWAWLGRADLDHAKLNDVDLRDAILKGASLTGATFSRVQLGGARLFRNALTEKQLSEVLDADEIQWVHHW